MVFDLCLAFCFCSCFDANFAVFSDSAFSMVWYGLHMWVSAIRLDIAYLLAADTTFSLCSIVYIESIVVGVRASTNDILCDILSVYRSEYNELLSYSVVYWQKLLNRISQRRRVSEITSTNTHTLVSSSTTSFSLTSDGCRRSYFLFRRVGVRLFAINKNLKPRKSRQIPP